MKFFTKKRIFFVVKYTILLVIIVLSFNFFKAVSDIFSGKLSYYTQIGWVDWNHALPGGTAIFIENYKNQSNLSQQFYINYEQRQKKLFYKMKAGIQFRVDSCKNDTINLYYIFTKVGTYFEEKQSNVPFLHSRLRTLGDETGNNISFYCAVTNTNFDEFKNSLEPESNGKTILRLLKNFLFISSDTNYNSLQFSNTHVDKFSRCIKQLKTDVNNCNIEIINKSVRVFLFDKKIIDRV